MSLRADRRGGGVPWTCATRSRRGASASRRSKSCWASSRNTCCATWARLRQARADHKRFSQQIEKNADSVRIRRARIPTPPCGGRTHSSWLGAGIGVTAAVAISNLLVPPVGILGILQDLPGWKQFFIDTGAKESGGTNHVEMFAMSFVESKLATELSNFVPKDRQQVGYDREATRTIDGVLTRLEIKGLKKDGPVQLAGNEPKAAQAAKRNGELFWVCVVAGIPENAQLWVIEDVLDAGTFDILKIDVSQWKGRGRRVG